MRKRVPVLKDGKVLRDEDGNVLEFNAVNQEELDRKIDAPQTAQVGEVLTVEEVDEDGKPTKWKTQIVDGGYDKILAAIDQAVFDKKLLVDILAGTCENLTGDAITAIADYVFYSKASLKTIDLPNCISIGGNAFYSCGALTTVNLPNCISIAAAAFFDCDALTTVDLPMATSIGENAFYDCDAITTVDLPMATSIGRQAFYDCDALTTVDLPMATSIGENAFMSCNAITTVDLPMVTSIEKYCLAACDALTTVNLPMVTSIRTYAFQSCYSLTTVNLPMVTSIATRAFLSCYSLTALVLGGTNVCKLANTNVFSNCYHILGTTNSTYNPTGAKDGYIYVPDDLVDSYKSATNWSAYASQIKPLSEYKKETE